MAREALLKVLRESSVSGRNTFIKKCLDKARTIAVMKIAANLTHNPRIIMMTELKKVIYFFRDGHIINEYEIKVDHVGGNLVQMSFLYQIAFYDHTYHWEVVVEDE